MDFCHLPRHGPGYATAIERPLLQTIRFISQTLRYVLPSTPQTAFAGSIGSAAMAAASSSGQSILQAIQWGIVY